MSDSKAGAVANQSYYDVNKNTDLVFKLFSNYYRETNHTGKMYEDLPEFFLFRPEVLEGKGVATKGSEKVLLEDCIQRAKSRNGYIAVSKHHNPKLGYYWLELSAMPFIMGDAVSQENIGEFYYLLARFIEFTKQNPKLYGDLTAELATDKDAALMVEGIIKLAGQITKLLKIYPEKMLVSYNPAWPVTEVQKMLLILKENEHDWCQLFFEYLIYVMGKKGKS